MKSDQSRNLYLILALVCFAGILAIFVVDGYLGIYDTLYISVQEREQKIEPDFWQERWIDRGGYNMPALWGDSVSFRYSIDNRNFSPYATNVDVSVWKSGEKLLNSLNKNILLSSFDDMTVEWTLSSEEIDEAGLGIGEYTVRIKHGEIERKVILDYYEPRSPQTIIETPVPPVR